ncbi:MAG TPA: beta-N-acetylhexosaminidase [Alphaproteobacteria bacterium]|nr:beta-N-acetylhexosaminidase [Alphaproteobacteria bacterium]
MSAAPRPVIFGCAGLALTAAERAFLRDADPLGFILFGRNIQDPDQVRGLVAELRAAVARADAPVLIDQEGGRVARLKPPHWREAPPAGRIGALVAARGVDAACEAARLNSRLLASELADLGIDVDCAPVADVPVPDAHGIIGDRAFAADPVLVGKLAHAAAIGLLEGGVIPIVKHIPGHGRARADSHVALPVVDEPEADLERSDFLPFRTLAHLPWAMTAHVLYRAIDPDRPATTSSRVIDQVIRGWMGFDGVLVSDDLSMEALKGDLASRARAAMGAGCDLVLHCTGVLAEMEEIASVLPPLSEATALRLRRGREMVLPAQGWDPAATRARLDELMGARQVGA